MKKYHNEENMKAKYEKSVAKTKAEEAAKRSVIAIVKAERSESEKSEESESARKLSYGKYEMWKIMAAKIEET